MILSIFFLIQISYANLTIHNTFLYRFLSRLRKILSYHESFLHQFFFDRHEKNIFLWGFINMLQLMVIGIKDILPVFIYHRGRSIKCWWPQKVVATSRLKNKTWSFLLPKDMFLETLKSGILLLIFSPCLRLMIATVIFYSNVLQGQSEWTAIDVSYTRINITHKFTKLDIHKKTEKEQRIPHLS